MPRPKQAEREDSFQYVYAKLKSWKFLSQNITDVKSLQGKLGKLVEDKTVRTAKSTETMSGILWSANGWKLTGRLEAYACPFLIHFPKHLAFGSVRVRTGLTQHGFYSFLVPLSCFNTAFGAFYLWETNLKNNSNCFQWIQILGLLWHHSLLKGNNTIVTLQLLHIVLSKLTTGFQ